MTRHGMTRHSTTERVALVVPPGFRGTTPNHEGSSGLGAVDPTGNAFRYAPHTVATMAAVLRDAGYEMFVLDAAAYGLDAMAATKALLDTGPQLIGVFVSWATRASDQLFLEVISAARPADVPVVACGVSVRLMHEALQKADHLLEGEPELSFRAVCDGLLRAKRPLARVIRSHEIAPAEYDAEGLLTDLDALPFPAWELVPQEHYSHLSILTSRGCPEACLWCPYVVAQGHHFRACSPDRVIHELRDIVRTHHARRVIVRDPAFAHDPKRLEQICRRIIGDRVLGAGKRVFWECESRPEYLERRLLRLMSIAGCVGIKIGLETTDQDLLQTLGRLPTASRTARYLARVASLARDCERLGIAYRVFAMAGLPGQTLESVQETAGFVHALHPFSLSAQVFRMYPELNLPISLAVPLRAEAQAQERVLVEVQRAIVGENHRASPHWRVTMERLASRLVAWSGGLAIKR